MADNRDELYNLARAANKANLSMQKANLSMQIVYTKLYEIMTWGKPIPPELFQEAMPTLGRGGSAIADLHDFLMVLQRGGGH